VIPAERRQASARRARRIGLGEHPGTDQRGGLNTTLSRQLANRLCSGRRLLEGARILDNEPPEPVLLSAKNNRRDAGEG
jgi:hypothetical protein